MNVIPTLNLLLCVPNENVQLRALQCLACLVYGNDDVAHQASQSCYNGRMLVDDVVALLERNRKTETQLSAARCLTYLCRCGVLDDRNPAILFKVLPCVVSCLCLTSPYIILSCTLCQIRLTKKMEKPETRIEAAETLTFLIETSSELQAIAAISNHLIPSMASFLTWEADPTFHQPPTAAGVLPGTAYGMDGRSSMQDLEQMQNNQQLANDMKSAAFKVFSALGANDEEIRKRIAETENLMPCLVVALDDPNPELRKSAIRFLLSLSRSVQLLRTTFQDHPMWKPLLNILTNPDTPVDIMLLASSAMCNLLLEFSPSKELILENGAVKLLCELTRKKESDLRLNGVWGLMVRMINNCLLNVKRKI